MDTGREEKISAFSYVPITGKDVDNKIKGYKIYIGNNLIENL